MRLAEIEAHIGSMSELSEIVGAMRSLAGMRLQDAQRTLPAICRYTDTVAGAIGSALALTPDPTEARRRGPGRCGLVLCTAEHGFVGGFNERILDAAEAAMNEAEALFVLGMRGALLAEERGRTLWWSHPMATRSEGVAGTVRRLSDEIFGAVLAGRVDSIEVIYTHYRQSREGAIERRRLFPVDLTRFASPVGQMPPLHNLPAGLLLERLAATYVSARLTEAATESLASENAARFAAMSAAHDNVIKKLEQLRQDARQARQAEITEELLDLVSGTAAARERPPRRTVPGSPARD